MPEFTRDWFTPNIPVWEQLFGPLAGQPLRALEVGCYEGRATLWLLDNVLMHAQSSITCVDTFTGSWEHAGDDFTAIKQRFVANTAPFAPKVRLYVGRSADVLRRLEGSFDLIYVDGSHEVGDVLTDAVLCHLLLAPGGLLIFDDYLWSLEANSPKTAIDAFLQCCGHGYALEAFGAQVALRRQELEGHGGDAPTPQ